MNFKEINIDGRVFRLNVEDRQWIRIRHDRDLEEALEALGNLPIAEKAKEVYREAHGEDIQISDESLAVEIIGHVLPGDLSYKIQDLDLADGINELMDELQSHTDVIDCGEKEVDGNRFLWDLLQIEPLLEDKRGEMK